MVIVSSYSQKFFILPEKLVTLWQSLIQIKKINIYRQIRWVKFKRNSIPYLPKLNKQLKVRRAYTPGSPSICAKFAQRTGQVQMSPKLNEDEQLYSGFIFLLYEILNGLFPTVSFFHVQIRFKNFVRETKI